MKGFSFIVGAPFLMLFGEKRKSIFQAPWWPLAIAICQARLIPLPIGLGPAACQAPSRTWVVLLLLLISLCFTLLTLLTSAIPVIRNQIHGTERKGPFKPQTWMFLFFGGEKVLLVIYLFAREEYSETLTYPQASFVGMKIIHHSAEDTVGVAIMWFLDGVMEFWCADPRRSPTSLSVAPIIYSAVLCFKLFGYVREGKPYLCTSICSGTIRLHYWSPNISFSVENVQIQAVCDWLHAESCSAGSVLSENELRPCSVTGAAWWPLNQHLSPRSTEIRPQSGRTSAPTDDLLFYLEQRQPEERWHMAFRANHSLLWGEQEFLSLPHQQPGTLLHVWILSGWSFLNVFYLFPLGPHLWHNDWTSLAQEVEAVHQSSLNLIPSLSQILVAPLPEPTCSVFHPSGISTPSLKSPTSKYSLLDSSTTIVHPFRCTEGNPRKRWKGKGPQPPYFPIKHTGKAGIYDPSKQGISIWAGESDPDLAPPSGCWWLACSRPSDTTMGSKLGSSLKSG